jgi:non-reducing end alpha-L-arabinofuranosidase
VATTLSAAFAGGGNNIKVASVTGFSAGQAIMIDTGANQEAAVIATAGTAGAATLSAVVKAGTTDLPVANARGFSAGQTVLIDGDANLETAVVASISWRRDSIIVTKPLTEAHAAGVQVSGTSITLASALAKGHARGTQIYDNVPSPGAPNKYYKKAH